MQELFNRAALVRAGTSYDAWSVYDLRQFINQSINHSIGAGLKRSFSKAHNTKDDSCNTRLSHLSHIASKMDRNGFLEAVNKSEGVPTASLFARVNQGLIQGTLKLPSLSQCVELLDKRLPVTFPAFQSEDYTYSPLPTSTSIRLLRVFGADEDGLLRCSLTTADLNDEPLFNCLSYTWVSS